MIPACILIRGLPGSGKSHVADALRVRLGSARAIVLDPDAIDYDSDSYRTHIATMQAAAIEAKYFPHRYLYAQAREAIRDGKIVIWNQAFTLRDGFERTTARLREFGAQHGSSDMLIIVVEVHVPEEVARHRIASRVAAGGHDVSDASWERFTHDYTSFADMGFPTLTIDGRADADEAVDMIIDRLGSTTDGHKA